MTDEARWGPGKIWAARLVVLAVFFVFWERAADSKLIDPILIGKPSGIVQYLVGGGLRHPQPVRTISTGRWAAP